MRLYWRVGLFAAMLAAAGIPLYIHLPTYAARDLGLSLSTVGAVLVGIRLFDLAQDPLLGWMVDRWPERRRWFAASGMLGMAVGFLMLFVVPPVGPVVVWMTLSLMVVFTCFSLATIQFYGQGVTIAGEDPGAHYRLAGFREAGSLAGVVLAALAPTLLAWLVGEGAEYRAFGVVLAVLALLVWLFTGPLWDAVPARREEAFDWRRMASGGVPGMLVLAMLNSLPVAITSTLFLFFVGDRLGLAPYAGAFLLVFFVAAGVTAPGWSRLVARFGPKRVLIPAMVLAILAFVWAAFVGPGGAVAFAVICVASGAALGADMVILPALFATVLAREDLPSGIGFGLWAFATKLSLALAAALVLPGLQAWGYVPGGPNSAEALGALTFAYAALPCALKLLAVAMVARLPAKGV